jgi:G:T/U-mismatch repair DNA glycosylase
MNAFWWIAGASLGFTRDRRLAPPANIAPHLPADLPPLRYKDQCDTLVNRGFVVWDVLHSCKRHGSLDSAIDTTDQQCNDIPELLARFPSITRVCFSSGASTAQSVRLARASFGVRLLYTLHSTVHVSHLSRSRAHTHAQLPSSSF